jgi:hypothetical protein
MAAFCFHKSFATTFMRPKGFILISLFLMKEHLFFYIIAIKTIKISMNLSCVTFCKKLLLIDQFS